MSGRQVSDNQQCDEAHPSCRKCKLYGVSCDYTGSKSSLDLSAQGSFQVDFTPSDSSNDSVTSQKRIDTPNSPPYYGAVADLASWNEKSIQALSPISLNTTMATMINDSLQANLDSEAILPNTGLGSWSAIPFWSFGESHLEIMARFHGRTSLTIGNKDMAYVYREIICKLSFSVRPDLVSMNPCCKCLSLISSSMLFLCICFLVLR